MFKKYHILFMAMFFSLDITISLLALHAADRVYPMFPEDNAVLRVAFLENYIYLVVAFIWAIFFHIFPLYSSKRATTLSHELFVVGGCAIASWIVFVGWLFAYGLTEISRSCLFLFGALDLLLLLLFHLALRIFLRFLRMKGYNLKKVLILGAGPVGQKIAELLLERPWAGFAVIGFLDDNPELHGKIICATPVLGSLDIVHEIVATMQVDDEVIIALPPTAHSRLVETLCQVEDIPVNVRVVPDLFGVAYIRPHVEDLWGIPLIGIRQTGVAMSDAIIKRVFDIVGAILSLLIFAPLMLIVAILIRLDSKGPVLFVQKRVGENGQPFKIYKFRTMVEGSEEKLKELINLDALTEPVFKIKNDPRVTRLGRVLRRTSIDELPQLFNVLRGEMSLVGPRPEETQMVNRYNSWQRRRLMMKPGMTGPMQVNGRGDLPLDERIKLEVDYIYSYSLWTDIEILLKTIPTVIRGKGSY